MQFPLIKLRTDEQSAIWAILNKYPQYLGLRYGLEFKIFGIRVHPSVGVHGVLVDLIGSPPV